MKRRHIASPCARGASATAFQRDWRIVVAGTVSNFSQGIESLALARYNYGGSLDTSFGDGGKVITTLGNTKAGAKDAIVLSNGQIAVLGWVYTAGNGAPAVIARFEGGPNPEITVEGPAGTPLNDGDAASTAFPPVVLGNSASLVFTIRNQGEAELIVPTITKSPTGTPGDFSIGTLGATSLAPGVSTTFTVSFSPTAPGVRTATVLIASNDEDENPFEINLTGSMATALEAWRQTYFGSPYDAGPGADLNDADGDGIVNLIEFATASDPTAPTLAPGQLVKNGTTLEFTYIRRKDALGEVSFVREYSVTLNGTWSRTGSTVETILSDDGTLQTVRVNTPAGSTGKRFVRLRVTRL